MKKQYCWRWHGLGYYNIEALETWLGEQAQKGLILVECKGTCAKFRRQEPQNLCYRFDAVQGTQEEPDLDLRELYAQYGWRWVCRDAQGFHVYSAPAEQVQELHTDPQLQAVSLKKFVVRAMWGYAWGIFAGLLLVGVVAGSWIWGDTTLLDSFRYGTFRDVAALLLAVFLLINSTAEQLRLMGRYRRLKQGTPDGHAGSSRRAIWRSRGMWVILLCIVVVYYASGFVHLSLRQQMNIADYQDPLPFLRVEDIENPEEIVEADFGYDGMDYQNFLAIGKDFAAHTYMEARQVVDVGAMEGKVYLWTKYYDFRAEWLAQKAVEEWRHRALPHEAVDTLPTAGADQSYIKQRDEEASGIALRVGTRVVLVELYSGTQDLVQYADRYVEQLNNYAK